MKVKNLTPQKGYIIQDWRLARTQAATSLWSLDLSANKVWACQRKGSNLAPGTEKSPLLRHHSRVHTDTLGLSYSPPYRKVSL